MESANSDSSPLARWERVTCGAVGSIAAVVGTVAVFVTENSVGTGVLLAVAAFFLLIGTTGMPVERAKIGDNEVAFARRVTQTMTATLNAADEEVRPQIAEAILDASPPSNDELSIQARAILFEGAVMKAITRIIATAGHPGEVTWQSGDRGLDARIWLGEGPEVKLIVKYGRKPQGAGALISVKGIEGRFLIVSSSGFTSQAKARAATLSTGRRQLSLVHWTGVGDDDQLRSALLDLQQ